MNGSTVTKLLGAAALSLFGVAFARRHGYLVKGNGPKYALDKVRELEASPLKGKHLAFLGSSVTEGARSRHLSFVEYLCKRNGCTCVKEAVSGTTLAENGGESYVRRMLEKLDPEESFDLFICQLSTNDAFQGLPLGEISRGKDPAGLDPSTVIGAMETIICYAQNTWHCPVVFYTGTKFPSREYAQMLVALYRLQEKWGVHIIDLWDSLDVDIPEYGLYMADPVHPTRAGYLEWWLPEIEKGLYRVAVLPEAGV